MPVKAPEDCVRAEENDGIYFRIYTEELVLGVPEGGAIYTEYLKEHATVLLQATLYSRYEIVVLQEAGDFPGDLIKVGLVK